MRRIRKVFCPEHQSETTFQEGVIEVIAKYCRRVEGKINKKTLLDLLRLTSAGSFNSLKDGNQVAEEGTQFKNG